MIFQPRRDSKDDPFKLKHPQGWEYGLAIETRDRVYKLFAKEYNLRELFVYMINQCLKKKEEIRTEIKSLNNSEVFKRESKAFVKTEEIPSQKFEVR